MRIHNTLGRRREEIVPLEPGVVRMYTCGPTVYRNIHIGNLRTFTMADWLRRTLEQQGYTVRQVKNITDVGHMRQEVLDRGEDKMIAQARREGRTSAQIAAHYTDAFRRDEAALHIQPAHTFPKATDHIPEMIAIVEDLVAKGIAYVVEGNVFFDVTRFPGYGALSGNQLAQALAQLQEDAGGGKRHPEDFPLWKRAEPGREMAWDSPWGRGFPGWHIECSAMAIRHLGPQLDIHTGGVDNIFPHHEDEIAQSEAHTGVPFARYWVHAQHLLSDGQKMAKSSGNAYVLEDVVRRGFDPLALRYLFALTHYRTRMNFTFSALRAAENGLRRMRMALAALRATRAECAGDDQPSADRYRNAFLVAIDDDLNLPRALAVIWTIIRRAPDLQPATRLALVLEADRILGLDLAAWIDSRKPGAPPPGCAEDDSPLHESAVALMRRRDAARHGRDFALADALRAEIERQGYAVRDTREGAVAVRRRPEEGFTVISRSSDSPDRSAEPDRYTFSVHLVAHDSRDDLERCIAGILRHRLGRSLEVVIVDNGSTDDTPEYLRALVRDGLVDGDGLPVDLQVFFADHDLGFAAARNAGLRAARGRIIVWLDTAIEPAGDIWTPLERALADPEVGLVGPYALRTDDLKEFSITEGPDADAVEGYLMAFRRSVLSEVGMAEEKFRFYRLLDIYMSFMFKTSGYRVLCIPEVADLVVKHPHREWYSLTPEEQATRSKKNFDIFRRRWHHGQSLQVINYAAADRWFGHDHPRHLDGAHTHAPGELPPPGEAHSHDHRHWPDHSHTHPHVHGTMPLQTP